MTVIEAKILSAIDSQSTCRTNCGGHTWVEREFTVDMHGVLQRYRAVWLHGNLIAELLSTEEHISWEQGLKNGWVRFYKGGMDRLTLLTKSRLRILGCNAYTKKGVDYVSFKDQRKKPLPWIGNVSPVPFSRTDLFPLKEWKFYPQMVAMLKADITGGRRLPEHTSRDSDAWGESLCMGCKESPQFVHQSRSSVDVLHPIGVDAVKLLWNAINTTRHTGPDYDATQWIINERFISCGVS